MGGINRLSSSPVRQARIPFKQQKRRPRHQGNAEPMAKESFSPRKATSISLHLREPCMVANQGTGRSLLRARDAAGWQAGSHGAKRTF